MEKMLRALGYKKVPTGQRDKLTVVKGIQQKGDSNSLEFCNKYGVKPEEPFHWFKEELIMPEDGEWANSVAGTEAHNPKMSGAQVLVIQSQGYRRGLLAGMGCCRDRVPSCKDYRKFHFSPRFIKVHPNRAIISREWWKVVWGQILHGKPRRTTNRNNGNGNSKEPVFLTAPMTPTLMTEYKEAQIECRPSSNQKKLSWRKEDWINKDKREDSNTL